VVDYYLINELSKNADGATSSFFMAKKRDGKLHFGPVWDFDLAFGNAGYDGLAATSGWRLRPSPWFARLFEDPAFARKVKDRWAVLKAANQFELMLMYGRARATWLDRGQRRNFTTWPIFPWTTWYTRVVMGSYEGEVQEMLRWQRERIVWMDAELSK
jgi:hypothetical protein